MIEPGQKGEVFLAAIFGIHTRKGRPLCAAMCVLSSAVNGLYMVMMCGDYEAKLEYAFLLAHFGFWNDSQKIAHTTYLALDSRFNYIYI